jgi:hypothetical protein
MISGEERDRMQLREFGNRQTRITSVTAKVGLTDNAGSYENIRADVEMTAEIHDGESSDVVAARLREMCRLQCQMEVDAILAEKGRPLKYYSGPRFQVIYWYIGSAVVIIPENEFFPTDGRSHVICRGQSADSARLAANKKALQDDIEVLDFSELHGDETWFDVQDHLVKVGAVKFVTVYVNGGLKGTLYHHYRIPFGVDKSLPLDVKVEVEGEFPSLEEASNLLDSPDESPVILTREMLLHEIELMRQELESPEIQNNENYIPF